MQALNEEQSQGQGKARHAKATARQAKIVACQGKARQGNARQSKPRLWHAKARQGKSRFGK